MPNDQQLSSWGEIAAYLGVSVRTAQTWESLHGLPVRRFPGPKGRVWAIESELNSWRESHSSVGPVAGIPIVEETTAVEASSEPGPEPLPPARRRSVHRAIWLATAIGLVAVAVIASNVVRLRTGQPISFRVESQILRTFDSQGKQVWEFRLPGVVVTDNYNANGTGAGDGNINGTFADLDGNGQQDLIFLYWRTATGASGDTDIYCFRSDGTVRWKKAMGKTVQTITRTTLYDRFGSNLVGILKKPRPDGGRIVIGSHHAFSWPEQVVLLTGSGEQVAEYWHPGWFFKMVIADIDGDGVEEIILGGVNNGYSEEGYGASLVVLDSLSFSGQGPVPPGDTRQLIDIPPAREAAVMLFPEFADNPDRPQDYCRITDMMFNAGHLELAVTKGFASSLPRVHYQLSNSLQVANVTPSLTLMAGSPDNLPPRDRQEKLKQALLKVKVLRNSFANGPR